MQYFLNSEGSGIILDVISSVKSNRDWLSKIDGEIGDGDHGVNMSKGFSMAAQKIEPGHNFSDANKILGQVLMMEIGGSMGPLYGTFFKSIFRSTKDLVKIEAAGFFKAIESSMIAVKELGSAEVGDKTLIDTLSPAVDILRKGIENNLPFEAILGEMIIAAKRGRDSTIELVARIGRSARLGERSRGVLDAGAASCYIILETMANSIIKILKTE
jgi:phosphoenolpyruvate---glycerone phosphotransferase subunit DhaL